MLINIKSLDQLRDIQGHSRGRMTLGAEYEGITVRVALIEAWDDEGNRVDPRDPSREIDADRY